MQGAAEDGQAPHSPARCSLAPDHHVEDRLTEPSTGWTGKG